MSSSVGATAWSWASWSGGVAGRRTRISLGMRAGDGGRQAAGSDPRDADGGDHVPRGRRSGGAWRAYPGRRMKIENVVYGMYSGLGLLMDVYLPELGRANGYGLVHICGSGWSAPLGLDARQLKEAGHVEVEALPLVEAGYTVCSINHRATPRFTYPAPVEDAQRAVRFFRNNAARFGIRP